MRLGLTDDQLAIKEVFAGFFGKESSPAVVRAASPADSTPTSGGASARPVPRAWA